jgi:hypothetical protein
MWAVADEEFLQDVMEDLMEEEFGEGLDYGGLTSEAVSPRVYRVVHRPPTRGWRPRFRLGPLISGAHAIRRALFPTGRSPTGGVWVQGGRGALRQFLQQYRLRNVTPPQRHDGGRTHVHATASGGGRSQHIFYGRLPTGDFFD